MVTALVVLGVAAEGAAWWWISARGASVWSTMTPVLVALGVLALVAGGPEAASGVSAGVAAGAGLGAGLALYAATRAFVWVVAARWTAFRAQSVGMYGRRGALPAGAAVALSVVLMVPGEELFWRGLVLPELGDALGSTALGAAVAWATFVTANLPSRNLAIVAGAAVGGAVWVGLARWSGGIVASLACHALWTALMLRWPPLPTHEG